jgi:hypothetical protein
MCGSHDAKIVELFDVVGAARPPGGGMLEVIGFMGITSVGPSVHRVGCTVSAAAHTESRIDYAGRSAAHSDK